MTDDLHQLAGPYALDALDLDEQTAFETHLASCSTCAEEVAGFLATAADLALAVAVAPPDGMKHRVLAEVARTRQDAPPVPDRVVDLAGRRRRGAARSRILGALAAAAVVIVAVVGVSRLGGDGDDPVLALMDDADAVVVELAPPDGAGIDGTLRIAWSPETGQAALIGDGLGDPGSGQVYEIWYVHDDKSVAPAGLFSPHDGSVHQVVQLDEPANLARTAGWAITVEPDAGSDTPTGETVYLGSF